MSARTTAGTAGVVARYEGRKRLRTTVVIAAVFVLFGALYLWIGPQVIVGDAYQGLIDSLPPALTALFGFESLESLEGLFASEFYTFGWIVGLGGYVAYSGAGTVSGDLRRDRMDLVLAAPITRRGVLLGKYLALLVPVLVLNVVVPVALYAGSVVVGDPLAPWRLAAVHALSVPYLAFWGALGIFLGVAVRGGRTAGRVALGVVFGAWLLESFLVPTDYARLGAVSPTQYFDPPAILVYGSYDLAGAGLLALGAVVLLGVAQAWFDGHDV